MIALAAAVVVLLGAGGVRAVWRWGGVPARLRGRRLRPPEVVRSAFVDVGVPWPVEPTWTVWVLVAVACVGTAAAVGGAGLALLAVATVAGGPALALATGRGRSGRLVDAALPGVLDGVARSLRSGGTLAGAVGEVAGSVPGRLGDDLRIAARHTAAGAPLVEALDGWAERCPTPGVRLATAALALAGETGGAAARPIDGVAATLRANLAVAAEARAQASQARLSGLVIALSPVGFGLLAAGADRRLATFLLRTPAGLACLAGGLALDALAAWWMHRITAVVAT